MAAPNLDNQRRPKQELKIPPPLVDSLVRFLTRQECAYCGRRPGELCSRTPVVYHAWNWAPLWFEKDRQTRRRFCSETCRASYTVHAGAPPRFPRDKQPESLPEAKDAFDEELENPTITENNWVAYPHEPRTWRPTGFALARIGAAAMLLIALADLPYGYYEFLRVIVCGVAAYSAYVAYHANRTAWATTFGMIAVLWNPVLPVRLDRSTWAVFDIAASLLFLASLRVLRDKSGVARGESQA